MSNKIIELKELNNEMIESKIYIVRGQKVMLDFELAEIYGYETKNFNRQVKNNINKFDEDFMLQLTKEEYQEILRCKNCTAQKWTVGNKGGRTSLPYVFTEQGIYMLMTVLKGELATNQSKTLIRIFKNMKDYLVENKELLSIEKVTNLTYLISNNSRRIDKIETKLDNFINNFSSNINKHYLIKDGEKIEADIAYQNIYSLAKSLIYIIDDYIDIKTLELLKSCSKKTEVILFTDNKSRNNLTSNFIKDFCDDTHINIKLIKNNNRFHDRYIIIDFNTNNEQIYHCGASSKDAGKRITTIIKIEEKEIYKTLINEMLLNEELILI